MLTPAQWQVVEQAFDDAVALPRDERDAFVEAFAQREPQLAARLRELLAADARDMDLAAPVAEGVAALSAEQDDPWVGRTVGAWTIVRRIAAGGMGAVFLAERSDEQLQQQAAIKIMTAQLLAADATARFRAERQILASLDHRFIARLLDGGTTDTRLPYLVMEYVDGQPVDAYCDEQGLDIDARLRLFVHVCEAVGYAHRNLIVHRDLKPSNILVNTDGEPRLLDFGIAKLLEGGVDVGTVAVTRQGMRVMTPEYASPEQVTGDTVTIATDVYALGVLLYRLLSGHHPYAGDLTTSVSIERAICETDPKAPSTRAQSDADDQPAEAIAGRRALTPSRLARTLRGDLDNIVLKAMRKEPDQRYESVRHLADDVQRYLDREPVRAHPPQLGYRVAKFVRRNAAPVIASAVALALFVGTVFFYTLRVTRERDRAQLEANKAQQVSEFVAGLFRTANPDETLGELITARELLDQGARRLDDLKAQPQVQASMQDVMGAAYQGLGLFDTSIELLQAAGDTRARLLGPGHRDTLESRTRLGEVLTQRGRLPESEALYRKTLAEARAADPRSVATAQAMHGLALALSAQSRFDEAGELFAQALALTESAPASDPFALAALLDDYGRHQAEIGQEARALPMIRRAIDLFKEARGDGHPSYLNALQNLGYTLIWSGEFAEAAAVVENMGTLARSVYGDEHPLALAARSMAGSVHYELGAYDAAVTEYRAALEGFEKLFGERHPESSVGANNLATALAKQGRYADAERYYRLGLKRNLLLHGEEHIEVATSYSNLGVFLMREGLLADAEEPILRGLAIRRKLLGAEHPNTLTSMSIYASYLRQSGQPERARELREQVVAGRRERLGETHPLYARELGRYGILLREAERVDEAIDTLRRARQIISAAYPGNHEEVADVELELARSLASGGDADAADAMFRTALERFDDTVGRQHPRTASALVAHGEFLLDAGRSDEARAALTEARRVRSALFAEDDWRLAAVDSAIGAAMLSSGQCDSARALLTASHERLRTARGDSHRLVRTAAERLNRPCRPPT